MGRNYLKIRPLRYCPKCKWNTLEVVVSGYLNRKRKEQLSTEKIIGYRCQNCGYQSKIKIWKKN